jgi:hypothetical protein
MDLESLRDLIIVIYAITGMVAIIFLLIISLLLFRKLGAVLDSTKATLDNVQGTSRFMSEAVIRPMIRVASFVQGARHAIETMARFPRRKEEKGHGQQ